jgi:hypothetical protein
MMGRFPVLFSLDPPKLYHPSSLANIFNFLGELPRDCVYVTYA